MQVKCRRADIDSAQDFFVFCRDHYTKPAGQEEHPHYRRMCFFVSTEDIPRDRERNTALRPLSKTRQRHCVKMVQPFVVYLYSTGRKVVPALETEREGRDHVRHHRRWERCSPSKGPKGKATEQQGLQLCLMSRMSMPMSNMVWCCGHS